MARASLCIFVLLVAVYNGFAQASLSVSPDRSQFFNYESVRLSGCLPKVTAGFAKWKIKRSSAEGERESCPSSWGTLKGSSCNIMDTYSGDTGVYWCESDSGERSNAVNITVTDGAVILASPAAPVTVGDGVTLRCLTQDQTTKITSLISPADFYKDGSLLRTESTGEMTIPAASKSDEGLYKCNNSDLGISPESWLAVRAQVSPTASVPSPLPPPPPPPPPAPIMSLTRLICHLVVASPYLLCTIILGVKYHRRGRGEAMVS